MSDNIKKESSIQAPPLKIESAPAVEDKKSQEDAPHAPRPASKGFQQATGTSKAPVQSASDSQDNKEQPNSGQAPRNSASAAKQQLDQATLSVVQWFEQLFPGHAHAVIFGLLGFLVAILLFIIGFWKTLLIVILVVLGVCIGQGLDGDPKIVNMVKHIWFNTRN